MPGMTRGSDFNERQAKAFGTAVLGRAKVVLGDEASLLSNGCPRHGWKSAERQVPNAQ